MSDPVRRTIRVRCSIERAFSAFTAQVDRWWPRDHRRMSDSQLAFEPRAGGRFLERNDAGLEAELGAVLRWEPPHCLAYTWFPGAINGPTHVEVRFHRDGDGTRVEVVHSEGDSGLGDAWPSRARRFVAAWDEVLPAWSRFLDETLGARA